MQTLHLIPSHSTSHVHEWPYLKNLLERQCLSYVDYSLASALLKTFQEIDESVAAFICHLSLAARKGNLCISLEAESHALCPDPSFLWTEGADAQSDSAVLLPEERLHLLKMIVQGSLLLPQQLLSDVATYNAGDPYPAHPICRLGTLFYFQRYWLYETLFIEHLRKLEEDPPRIKLNPEPVTSQVNALKMHNRLLPEQADAILMACNQGLSIICGGPGTGKTYTAGELIKVFWNSLSLTEREHCEIALAAPTGKAAANLQNSLSRVTSQLEGFPPIQAKTLHSLLGIRGNFSIRQVSQKALTADLILVDESSMIDVYLMTHLFASLKPGSRLILLGDRFQLPSVEAGTFFSDLVAYLIKKSTGKNQVTELKTCLRAELRTIIEFAAAINVGDLTHSKHLLSSSSLSEGVCRLDLLKNGEDPKSIQETLLEHSKSFFHPPVSILNNIRNQPLELLNHFNRYRILAPFRKGPFGVDRLNLLFLRDLMRNQIGKKGQRASLILPIILTHNDRRLELFNGEVGVLVRFSPLNEKGDDTFQEGDYAIFPNKNQEQTDSPIRIVPALLLPKYEYAFCLSVHKSQGSEFEHVLLMMPEGAEQFGREVLYTAVTRAKRKLELWVSDATLEETISRPSHRLSGLSQRL